MLENNTSFWKCCTAVCIFELQNKCSHVDGCVDPEIIADKFVISAMLERDLDIGGVSVRPLFPSVRLSHTGIN